MNVAAKHNSKFHGPAPHKEADMSQSGVQVSLQNHNIKSSIDGEMNDLPGQRAASMATIDYGEGRHEVYDSPLVQPAYSGHGKVRVGSSSAL